MPPGEVSKGQTAQCTQSAFRPTPHTCTRPHTCTHVHPCTPCTHTPHTAHMHTYIVHMPSHMCVVSCIYIQPHAHIYTPHVAHMCIHSSHTCAHTTHHAHPCTCVWGCTHRLTPLDPVPGPLHCCEDTVLHCTHRLTHMHMCTHTRLSLPPQQGDCHAWWGGLGPAWSAVGGEGWAVCRASIRTEQGRGAQRGVPVAGVGVRAGWEVREGARDSGHGVTSPERRCGCWMEEDQHLFCPR